MALTQRTIWYVEMNLDAPLTLAAIARDMGVTGPHLARTFAGRTGLSVMRYVRRRRLARAAVTLSCGESSVIAAALDAGYASHEAFTRAFSQEFGIAPKTLRHWGDPARLSALKPLEFHMSEDITLTPDRMVDCAARTFVGINSSFDHGTMAAIPQQWARFNTTSDTITQTLGQGAFGVIHNFRDDGTWDYASAYEVSSPGVIPAGYEVIRLPASRFAVFRSDVHISRIGAVMEAVMAWIARSDFQFVDGPTLEFYGPSFDPQSGEGGFEIWAGIVARDG